MTKSTGYYRKNLTSHGFVYLANEEIEIAVRNLSLTGVLAEIGGNFTLSRLAWGK